MSKEYNAPESKQELNSTDLSFERTILSHERTLMSWVRTAASLISFGFTLYKFLEEVAPVREVHQHKLFTPRIVGMFMISFGLIGLLLALIQHHTSLRRLKRSHPLTQRSISSVLAILMLAFGVALFLGTWFRQ